MKPRSTLFLLLCIIVLLISCVSTPAKVADQPTAQATQPQPQDEAPASPTAAQPPISAPLPSPTTPPPFDALIGARFEVIPFGSAVTLKDGERTFSLKINKTFQGREASEKLFNSKPPEKLDWALIQLFIQYLEGPKGERTTLLDESGFDIISHGHVLNQSFTDFSYTPSPWLSTAKLLPGETSLAWLTFYVYADDAHPILRLNFGGSTYFFALLDDRSELVQAEETPEISADVLTFGEEGAGTQKNPLPFGYTLLYDSQTAAAHLYLTIEKSYRGFQAWKRVSDFWGINDPPPAGMEYVLAYVTIRVVEAGSDPIEISPYDFDAVSGGKTTQSPNTLLCNAPCFGPMSIYPGGKGSGWLAVLVNKDDPNPLLRFEDTVWMTLISDADKAAAEQSALAENAIGYGNIQSVKPRQQMAQVTPVHTLAFSPDSSLLASGSDDRKIHIWQVSDGSQVQTLTAHKAAVKDLSFSPDGSLLASVSYDDQVLLWDTASWEVVQTLKQDGKGIFARFLADGTLVTATQAGKITLWDAASGEALQSYKTLRSMHPSCSSAALHAFDVNSDGSLFGAALSCGFAVFWQPGAQTAQIVDSNNAADLNQWPYTAALDISPLDDLAAYGSSYYKWRGQLVDVINLSSGKVDASLGTATLNIPAIAYSSNGEVLVAAIANTLRGWWPEVYRWPEDNVIDLNAHEVQVTAIEFSPNGAWMASGDYSGKIVLWSAH